MSKFEDDFLWVEGMLPEPEEDVLAAMTEASIKHLSESLEKAKGKEEAINKLNECQFCSHPTYNKKEKYFVCPFEDYDPINPCKHFVKGDKDNFAEKNKEVENE